MRLRLLIVTNLFPTPWDPQRGAFNRQQFEQLGQHHDVDVLTAVSFAERKGEPVAPVAVKGLRTDEFVFYYPPRIGRSLHALCFLLSLWWQRGRRLRAAGYDCVLASWGYPDAVAAGWLARRLRIPYVVKVHGSDLNVQAERALQRPQIRAALRGARAVVAVSRALAGKAIGLGVPAARVHVLYNGVDPALFHPGDRARARAKLSLPSGAPLILYVGNLKASKGCDDLLEAFPAVLDAQPGAHLVFVGDGPSGMPLRERAAALGCLHRVSWAGKVAHGQLAGWFRAADLLCLPSHNEGVPNVVLEAMACGTPVVASRVGGIPEVVPGDAGILVPPRDRAALSAALVEATRRPWDGTRIAAHAARFRWDDNIAALDAILRESVVRAADSLGATA
ncbi:glycosyltransferase family 4 protein [Dyella sedimenti]|uniref:glycosyltransferase family 4 protein n=1 Tax=Dyella sedimenti TaxID=2919947 RepID=UPI001FA972E2|nr:glycosyltransferase family 4 protein [Dyella sedimenti]